MSGFSVHGERLRSLLSLVANVEFPGHLQIFVQRLSSRFHTTLNVS